MPKAIGFYSIVKHYVVNWHLLLLTTAWATALIKSNVKWAFTSDSTLSKGCFTEIFRNSVLQDW